MGTRRGWLIGTLVGVLALLGVVASLPAQDDAALAYYRQAKINWRLAEGQSLTIGLNKHPFTESLLPRSPSSSGSPGSRSST